MGEEAAKQRINETTHRWCTKCHRVRALEEFPRHKDHPGGRMSTCKECRNATVRRHRAAGRY